MEHSFLDEYSRVDSLVHRLEPRVKILAIFLFILSVISIPRHTLRIFAWYGMVFIALSILSKIPLWFIFKRVFSALPFIMLVAFFMPFIPPVNAGQQLSLGSIRLPLTYSGLQLFAGIVMKASLSVMAMTLLMASTDFSSLLKALEKLRIPAVLTMIVSFMYRYIFVLEDELMKMKLAKDCRSVGGSRWFHLKAQANMLGVFFIRAYERAEKVYLAMCARGFDGQIRVMHDSRIKAKDVCFLIFFAGIMLWLKCNG